MGRRETVMGVVEATLRADGEGETNSSRTRGVPCRRGGSGRCHTRFYKENRMHLICAPGSFTHT
jgi:hypothetical protein